MNVILILRSSILDYNKLEVSVYKPCNLKGLLPGFAIFLLITFAGIGNLRAATFTSIANGNWSAGSTWMGGTAPGSTISAADIVNIGHVVTYNLPSDLEVFGMVNITNGTFRTTLTGDGMNRSVTIRSGGEWNMCNAQMYLPIFACGYDCFTPPLGSNLAGNFRNEGGEIFIFQSTVHIAQNWEDVSSPGTGMRSFTSGCMKIGENFSNKGSIDLYDNSCIELGYHGSGNWENEYLQTFQNSTSVKLIGSSGNVKNSASSPNGVLGGPGSPDIFAFGINNGNMTNDGPWSASVENFCIDGGSVGGSMAADFTADITNNDTPAACAAVDAVECTDCPTGVCMLMVTASVVMEPSCGGGSDGSVTATVTPGTATTSCGGSSTVTYLWNTMPPQTTQTAINLPPGTYTVTVTDAAGCTATASATLTASGGSGPPVINCPAATSPIECPATPAFPPATGTDACGGTVTLTFVDVTTPSGVCPQEYSVTRTWTATDGSATTATCSQTVSVTDNAGPVITCPTATSPIECPATPVFPQATASDGCDGTVTITFVDVTTPSGICSQEYSVTRTWTATDDCSNSSTCSQTVSVTDNTGPVLTCPTVMSPIECPATPVFPPATATDECDGSVTITFVDVTTPSGICPQEYSVTRTWTATDDCGNASTCSRTVAVVDDTPPSITCPAATTPIECPATPVFPTATASDICDATVTITFVDVTTPSGICPQEYSVTRTWTATDDCANSATCSQTVAVTDNTAPVITCPTTASPIECPATPTFPPAIASDLCDATVTITFVDVTTPSGICPQEYSVTRTWTATDDCSNSSTCSRTIAVTDNTAPVITCPTVVSPIECPATPTFPPATASDLCDATVTITFVDVTTPSGICPQEYSVTRTWTATDDCSNSSTCSRTIAVTDNTAPVITCPTVVSPIECPATPVFPPATATDACDIGDIQQIWINEIHYDNTGTDVGEFVEVAGTAGIDLSLYSIILYNGANGLLYDSDPLTGFIDNEGSGFGAVSLSYPSNGVQNGSPDGVALVLNPSTVIQFLSYEGTFTALDGPAVGMLSTDIGVSETGSASGGSVGLTGSGSSYAEFTWSVIADDTPGSLNMGQTIDDPANLPPTITFVDVTTPSGICPQEYSVTRTWTATDDCSNSSTCSRTIAVTDNTAPVITCPTVVSPIECPATPTFPPATASDLCDATVTITFVDVTTPSGICPQEYSVTRTWTATDDCSNSSTCSRTIAVTDNTAPVITCPTVVSPVECPATPTFPPATASDICDATVTITFVDVTTPSGICPQEYSVTRTWTATDDCSNSSTCSRTIAVTDNTAPVITCPTVVSPIECPATPVFPPATASDLCDATVTITFVDVTTPSGICPQEYSVTRTWRATDDCSNSSTCSRTIAVTDNTAPVITCPTVVSPIECPATPVFPPATASDLCDATVTITFVDVTTPSGICPQEYSVTRTWTATDDCSNSSTCSRTIAVTDNTAPVITCPTVVSPIECPATPTFPPATASDLCDATVTITFVDITTPSGICPQEYSVTRTWTATDDCSNSSTCSRTIAVTDNTAPVITCPTVVSPIECPVTPTFPPATASDLCDATVTITFVDITTPSGICPQEYSVTRTWTATDDCSNSSTCSRTIAVTDNTAPVITCPTVVSPIECPATPVFPPATASDLCDATVTITFVDVTTPSGICPQEYSVTRTWRATDDCSNSSTCSRTIAVTDNTAPVITCPTVVSPIECPATPSFPPATASDLCDATVTITFVDITTPSGICPQEYSVTRTWTATDDCSNSSTCSRTVAVTDNTAPVITCPTVVSPIECPATPTFPPATASDLCDATVTITFVDVTTPSGICPQEYSVTRTWRATDDCSNSSTCSRTIAVTDNTAPVITCPTVVSPIECPATPVFPPATASDLCDATVTITFVDVTTPSGICPQEYSVTRTWTATDDCSNSSTCSRTIAVTDNTAPVIICPMVVSSIECPATPVFPPASASDLCDATVTITFADITTPSGICPQEYSVTRTWTATDDCSNSSTCSRTIAVTDNTAPVITCPTVVSPIECPATPTFPPATASDLCDATVTITFVDITTPSGICPQEYSVTRTWTATDDCSNSSTCSRTIAVTDNTAPVITCPTIVSPIECPATPVFPPATASDLCDATVTITFVDVTTPSGICPQEYSVTRTWTATDDCSNSSTCSRTIAVTDNTAPVITCPTVVSPIECPATPVFPPATASDLCDATVTITFVDVTTPSGICPQEYSVTRTWTATDDCSNSSTCSRTIAVTDNTAPVLACPTVVTPIECPAIPVFPPATASDLCDASVTITFVDVTTPSGICPQEYSVTRTWTATDDCSNSSTCSRTIAVTDNTAPVITCPIVPASVECPAVPTFPPATAIDLCDASVTITFSDVTTPSGICPQEFSVTRTWRATDDCGNSSTCSRTIARTDNTAPVITCPTVVTPIECPAMPVFPPATATDLCDASVTITFSDVTTPGVCPQEYCVTRTWRATDDCGNSSTCSRTICVTDNTPPVITFTDPLLVGVPNGGTVEVQCFGQDPEWDLPTFDEGSVSAVDACAPTVIVTFNQVLLDEGDCEVDGYILRYRLTWTATDPCGNSSSAFVFLELVDTIAPVIHNIPPDVAVSCDEIPEPPTDIFATDECLCACVIDFNESEPAPGCQDGQIIVRTWIAKDDCGNMTIETQNITLIDIEGPVITIEEPDELEGLPDGTILYYTCNEGGIPDFFDELTAESVSSPVICGTSGVISFDENTIIANNCKFWGYIEQRTFEWTGTDQCGNVTTLTIIARLIDTEDPVILGVPDTTCIGDPALSEVEAIDNCGFPLLHFWDVEIPNPCGDGKAMRRTYEAIDDCGNMVRDTAILIPNDQTPPVMEFVNPILADLEFGEVVIVDCEFQDGQYTPFGVQDVSVEDDCPIGMNIAFTETLLEEGDCLTDGIVAVIRLRWTATDVCGNFTILTARAHVVDKTGPEFLPFEIDVTIDCNDDFPEVFATDNCGEVTISTIDSVTPGNCPYEYDVLREITATDPCGNSTTEYQSIHVRSDGPVIEGVVEELCDDLSIPDVTATDPCTGERLEVTMTEDTLDIPCRDGFVIERTWGAVDACGNLTVITQHIVVGDHTPPEILIPSHSIIRKFLDVIGQNLIFLSQTDIIAQLDALNELSIQVVDDCDQDITPVFSVVVTYSDDCVADGYYERRVYSWYAEDVCGNSVFITFTVDIMDDIPPVLFGVPEDITVICAQLPPVPIVTAEDWSQPVTIVYSQSIDPSGNPGEFIVTRTWVVTDACGNSSKASQIITWIPDTFLDCEILLPESVECNTHGVVITGITIGGIGPFTYEWEIIGEECFIQSGQGTSEIIIYVGWSDVQIFLTVTDAYGCTGVCSAILECTVLSPNGFAERPIIINPETHLNPGVPTAESDNEEKYLQHFSLRPNPANESVTLSFDSSIKQVVQFTMTNFLGQVVLSDEMDAIKGFNNRKIDVSHLPEGSYLMQLVSDSDMQTKILVLFRK